MAVLIQPDTRGVFVIAATPFTDSGAVDFDSIDSLTDFYLSFGIDGLTNPRGFIIVDKHQRNPKFPDVFALGVCVAIAPTGPTPVPVGVPKTGFMIESMVSAIAANLDAILDGREPTAEASWNAICLADFGDEGIAFIAQPQIPPRNVNWSSQGKWVHLAKIGFEKYFLRKIRKGESEPFYEKLALDLIGVHKLKP